MQSNTCEQHKTQEQKDREDHRSVEQKRRFYKVGDEVVVSDKFRQANKGVPGVIADGSKKFDGGRIIDFKDPYSWDGKNSHSIAGVELPCGCIEPLNVSWMR